MNGKKVVIVNKCLTTYTLYKTDAFGNKLASLFLPAAQIMRLADEHPYKRIIMRFNNTVNGKKIVQYGKKYTTTVARAVNPFFNKGEQVYVDLSWIIDHSSDPRYVHMVTVGAQRTRMLTVNCSDDVLKQYVISDTSKLNTL